MGITFLKWTQAKTEGSWSESIDKVQVIVSVSRLHMVVQSIYVQVKYILLQIWAHQVTPKSVGSLTLKSRERLAHGVILIDILCLVCWPSSCHRKIQKQKVQKKKNTPKVQKRRRRKTWKVQKNAYWLGHKHTICKFKIGTLGVCALINNHSFEPFMCLGLVLEH